MKLWLVALLFIAAVVVLAASADAHYCIANIITAEEPAFPDLLRLHTLCD